MFNFKRINDFDLLNVTNNSKTAVVVMHGFGASMNDLAPLYDYLDPAGKFDWYFLDAPHSIDIGMGMTGKAWFPIDMMKLQTLTYQGRFHEMFKEHRPKGIDEAISKVVKFLNDLKASYEKIYVGGFSQGSMMSLGALLNDSTLAQKLFLLSSTLFDEQLVRSEIEKLRSIPIFQSHGKMDPVLPFDMAQALSKYLENNSDYEMHPFVGGHEIPLEIIKKLKIFLEK